jgi:hypothetical protein
VASDVLIDLLGLHQPFVGDAARELVDISEQALLVLAADGVILGDALLAAAEHIGVLILDAGLDLDRGLLLGGVEQGRLAPHRRKAIGILEIGEPAVALGLPTGDNVVELARFELGKVVVIGHAAVENHGGSLFEANALTQAVEHGRKAGAILDVPGENLMRDLT